MTWRGTFDGLVMMDSSGAPPSAIFWNRSKRIASTLEYMPVQKMYAMAQVCRSFCGRFCHFFIPIAGLCVVFFIKKGTNDPSVN